MQFVRQRLHYVVLGLSLLLPCLKLISDFYALYFVNLHKLKREEIQTTEILSYRQIHLFLSSYRSHYLSREICKKQKKDIGNHLRDLVC